MLSPIPYYETGKPLCRFCKGPILWKIKEGKWRSHSPEGKVHYCLKKKQIPINAEIIDSPQYKGLYA